MRTGAEFFVRPAVPAQRRYEALRAYFVDEATAAEVGGALRLLAGDRAPARRRAAGRSHRVLPVLQARTQGPAQVRHGRDQVLDVRAEDRSVTEIARRGRAEGTPVSAQTVWAILHAEGIERLGRRADRARRHASTRSRPDRLLEWPAGSALDCDHAGLYLLVARPRRARPRRARRRAPTTPAPRSSPRSTRSGPLLLLKCSRRGRTANALPARRRPRPRSLPRAERLAQGHPLSPATPTG